ncbi:MAG: glycosyltransferase family 4 protein [Brevinematia bacterium]
MKVLVDGRSIDRTGIGTYTKLLLKGILPKLEKVYLMGSFIEKPFEGVNIIHTSNSIYSIEEQINTFIAELKVKNEVDLVHYVNYNKSILSVLPFVITIHDLIQFKFSYSSGLKRKIGETILKSSLKHSSAIICVSNSTKNDLLDLFGVDENKVFVVYNPALNPFSKEVREVNVKEKYNLGKYILSVGNRKKHKNLSFLIDSMELISKQFPELSLVIIGKRFDEEDEVDFALRRSSVKDKILVLENVSYEELVSFYKNAEIVLVPSLYEGFGLVPFEGINFGTLPLVSDIKTFRELFFEDNDFFFDPYSTESLVRKIEDFYNYEKRKTKIEKLKKYLDIYSYDRFINDTFKVYEFALKNR